MVTPIGQRAWETLRLRAEVLGEAELRALSPLVILAPHADDETLGCGGLLSAVSDLGLQPRVAFLTDGSASHQGSPSWPQARLVETRKAEALAALAELGVATQIRFLDWPDSAPHPPGSTGFDDTVENLLDWFAGFSPKSVWAPWPKEAHCDHEAAAILAREAAKAADCKLMSYPVWGWLLPPDQVLPVNQVTGFRLPIAPHLETKRFAVAAHASQYSNLIQDSPDGFRLPRELLSIFERPYEVFLT